jgi:hypothetical protein
LTLCAAWIRGQNVYLIADSAVTKGTPLTSARSHFGELHENHRGRSVEESALKIFRQEHTAVGFAGDADLALEIFKTYVALSSRYNAREAFECAWYSNTPFNDRICFALLAFYDGNHPRLIQFGADTIIEPADGCAVIGALSESESDLVKQTLLTLRSDYEPNDVLSLCIVSLQRHSIFYNFMHRGIGGHYAGLSIGADGLAWMPPLMHIIFDGVGFKRSEPGIPAVIVVFPSNDMILVQNNIEDGWVVFMNSSGENFALSDDEWLQKTRRITERHSMGQLPYRQIAIYDTKSQMTTVLLIDGLVPSPDVYPRFDKTNGTSRFVIDFSESLLKILERDFDGGSITIHDCRE